MPLAPPARAALNHFMRVLLLITGDTRRSHYFYEGFAGDHRSENNMK